MAEKRAKPPAGAINLRLFLHLGTLPICQTQAKPAEEVKHCCADIMIDREVAKTEYAIVKKYGGRDQKGARPGKDDRYNKTRRDGGYNDFEKGTAKNRDKAENWLQEDNHERVELRKKA